MQKPHVENNHIYLGSMIREKNKKMRNFTDFWITSVPTYSIHAQRHPKFGILATVCCRVNFTLEKSHKLLDKTYDKNYFKYFKYDWNVQYIRQVYI